MNDFTKAIAEAKERLAEKYVLREFPEGTATDDDRAIAWLAHKAGFEASARLHELKGRIVALDFALAYTDYAYAGLSAEKDKLEAELSRLLAEGK